MKTWKITWTDTLNGVTVMVTIRDEDRDYAVARSKLYLGTFYNMGDEPTNIQQVRS